VHDDAQRTAWFWQDAALAAAWCAQPCIACYLPSLPTQTDGGSTPCSCCSPGGLGGKPTARYASEFTRLTQDFFAGKMDCIHFERDVALAGHGLSLLLVAEVGGCCSVWHCQMLSCNLNIWQRSVDGCCVEPRCCCAKACAWNCILQLAVQGTHM
jgi:hypothetical protein